MNKLSAMQGTYSDFKLVKTRSMCQLVIEIPIEQAEQVISTFGIPQPGKETWLAIALIDQTAVEKPRRMGLSQQAALMATKPDFWNFLDRVFDANCMDEQGATGFIKQYCNISSRKELDAEDNKAFRALQLQFQDYLDEI